MTEDLDPRQLLYLQNYLFVSGAPNPAAEKAFANAVRNAHAHFLKVYFKENTAGQERTAFLRYKEAIAFFTKNRSLRRGRTAYITNDFLRNLEPFSSGVKRSPGKSPSTEKASSEVVSLQPQDENILQSVMTTTDMSSDTTIATSTVTASDAAGEDWKTRSAEEPSSMAETPSMSSLVTLASDFDKKETPSLTEQAEKLLSSTGDTDRGSAGDKEVLLERVDSLRKKLQDEMRGAASRTPSEHVHSPQDVKEGSVGDGEKDSHSEESRGAHKRLVLEKFRMLAKKVVEQNKKGIEVFSVSDRRSLFSGHGPNMAMFSLTEEDQKHRSAVLSAQEETSTYDGHNKGHVLLRNKLWCAYVFAHALVLAGKGNKRLNRAVSQLDGAPFEKSLGTCYELLSSRAFNQKDLMFFWDSPKMNVKFAADHEAYLSVVKAQAPLLIKITESVAEQGLILPYPAHLFERLVRIINVNAAKKSSSLWSELEEALQNESLDEKVREWIEKAGIDIKGGDGKPGIKLVEVARSLPVASSAARVKGIYACMALVKLWHSGAYNLTAVRLEGKIGKAAQKRSDEFAGLYVMTQPLSEKQEINRNRIAESLLRTREFLSWIFMHTAWALSFESDMSGAPEAAGIGELARGVLNLKKISEDDLKALNKFCLHYAEKLASFWGDNALQALLCVM